MSMERARAIAWFLLRVVAGWMFFQAGAIKILGWFGGMPPGMPEPPPAIALQMTIGGWLELVGGLLVMVGLLTRPVAFILAGEMAVAYWQFHFKPDAFWPAQNGGVPAVLFCFVFLYMAAKGAGEWSVDGMLRKRRS